ncbi:MAG: hypothetical protein ACR2GY_10685 [Phycisphaerales bacterium]
MQAFFEGQALLFTLPALLGTLFFLLRMAIMLIGIDADADVDMAAPDLVTEVDLDGADVGDSTDAFNLLSVQSIAGFVMGFGWAGLIGYKSLGWETTSSVLLGVAGGLMMAWLLAWMFKMIYSMQDSGNISINQTIGREGEVYAQIPARGAGRGQVRVVVNQRARIYSAISEADPIATKSRIRVVSINDDNSVTVVAA